VAAPDRKLLLAAAMRWSALSLAWAGLVGAAAVAAGLAAASVALVGFGANSLLDGSASAVLVHRFRHEHLGRGEADAVERLAGYVVGAAMVGVAIYLGASSISALATHSEPSRSGLGIGLASASVLVFPVLARAKLRLATPLGSTALRGDGVLSLAGAVLAGATLVSLLLDAALDWWWADAVAALLIAAILLAEGSRTIANAR
jgi:divalent metal cation (Fe/Co/Zn/Cd) transporter